MRDRDLPEEDSRWKRREDEREGERGEEGKEEDAMEWATDRKSPL